MNLEGESATAHWRPVAFRISLWALIAVLYFFSPFVLVVLGWFQEPFSDLGGAEVVSHRVHEVLFGVIFAQAMAGVVSQLLSPIKQRAGMLQTLAVLFGFVGALAAIGVVEALGIAFVALALIATVLHPVTWTDWLKSFHPRPGLIVLALSATMPFLFVAIDNFAKAQVQAADHLSHWGGVSAFAIVQILLAIIASLRPPGYRMVSASVGVAGLVYFASSLLFPFDASAPPAAFAIWLFLWSVVWLAVAFLGERQFKLIALVGGFATVLLVSANGVIGLTLGVVLAGSLILLGRRPEGLPKIVSRGLSGLGFLFLVGGGLLATDPGEAPNVPHGLTVAYDSATSQTCLDCHEVGANGATVIPHESDRRCLGDDDEECWDDRTDCLGCHRYDPALSGSTESAFGPVEIAFGRAPTRAPNGGGGLNLAQLAAANALVEPAPSPGSVPAIETNG